MSQASYRQSIRAGKLVKGFAVGFLVAGGWFYYAHQARLRRNAAIPAELINATGRAALDEEMTRVGNDLKKLHFTLYRYLTCPFCGKVKAFLDYHRIPHTVTEVEPMFKPQIGFSAYQKVPQLTFGAAHKCLADSEGIVGALLSHTLNGRNPTGPNVPPPTPVVEQWRGFASDILARHIVVAINGSVRAAWQTFDYINDVPNVKAWEKLFLHVAGAPVMYLVAQKKTKPTLERLEGPGACADPVAATCERVQDFVMTFPAKSATAAARGLFSRRTPATITYGASSDLPPGLDASTGAYDASRRVEERAARRSAWTEEERAPFHGGAAPDLADVEVYGVLQSARLTPLWRDLVATEGVSGWLARMDAVCTDASTATLQKLDALPPSVVPSLAQHPSARQAVY